jgi:predicted nucleic acid-binding protein
MTRSCTVVDTGVLVGLLDANDVNHDAARHALTQLVARGDRMALPAPALAELLVAPIVQGADAVSVVDDLLARAAVTVLPADGTVARRAAYLRAAHGRLTTADALVIATADVANAAALLTTSEEWPTARALGIGCRIERIGTAIRR